MNMRRLVPLDEMINKPNPEECTVAGKSCEEVAADKGIGCLLSGSVASVRTPSLALPSLFPKDATPFASKPVNWVYRQSTGTLEDFRPDASALVWSADQSIMGQLPHNMVLRAT